uniref:NADH dehydrogenase subunit 6 n=1 Tax=Ammothea clausi TaxID=373258 RepID=UPI002264FF41|nr:NADH dehydrogenase subunit 6 [Ammothea clausi]UYX57746.1 NADH dehydrogenase subunit 6 [Ammothea clausi]
MKFTLTILLMLPVFMLMTNNPLFMVIMILMETLLISLMINYINLSFWMSYILILIFLGGMLVIFIYIASLTDNTNFFTKMNMMSFITFLMLIFYMMYMNYNNLNLNNYYNNKFNFMMNQPLTSMSTLYNNMMYSTIIMAVYLMITLFIIVKLCNSNKNPLKKN